MPTLNALAPSAVTMNSGSRLWIISDEMSISRLVKPSIQMPAGRARPGGGEVLDIGTPV